MQGVVQYINVFLSRFFLGVEMKVHASKNNYCREPKMRNKLAKIFTNSKTPNRYHLLEVNLYQQ